MALTKRIPHLATAQSVAGKLEAAIEAEALYRLMSIGRATRLEVAVDTKPATTTASIAVGGNHPEHHCLQ